MIKTMTSIAFFGAFSFTANATCNFDKNLQEIAVADVTKISQEELFATNARLDGVIYAVCGNKGMRLLEKHIREQGRSASSNPALFTACELKGEDNTLLLVGLKFINRNVVSFVCEK